MSRSINASMERSIHAQSAERASQGVLLLLDASEEHIAANIRCQVVNSPFIRAGKVESGGWGWSGRSRCGVMKRRSSLLYRRWRWGDRGGGKGTQSRSQKKRSKAYTRHEEQDDGDEFTPLRGIYGM